MKKTKLFYPYINYDNLKKRNTPTLNKTGIGVYVIYEDKKIVYVGFSRTDVKKTLYRHFQKWNDKRHPENKRMQRIERVTYMSKYFINQDYKIKVIFCKTPENAEDLESALITKLQPRDNDNKLNFDTLTQISRQIEKFNDALEITDNNYNKLFNYGY